ncbi:SOS response-associated peptidase [Natronosalvus halobius]|uniref:SOS response-associated peptidase n=1 Tax=Natronosalvus halobius TaxID=2953746 RepID=UPI0020A1B319|nr:SOS response-associated peptidase [Natronosalvus halobius]USZ70452.1 SOS response-associated peptidase [Natronosalvus halobius]
MCGRYTLFLERGDLEDRFDARFPSDETFAPRYNAAPGQRLPVITNDEPATFQRLEWGLRPAWLEDVQASSGSSRSSRSNGLINARAETVAEKPSFRPAYEMQNERSAGVQDANEPSERSKSGAGDRDRTPVSRGRCLVPADGFYEWAPTENGGKQPYRVALADDRPFAMAGLWERWKPDPETTQAGLEAYGGGSSESRDESAAEREPGPVETFTVLTTRPNDLVADLHDRMAVILEPGREREWLTADDPRELLKSYPAEEMRTYPVSTAVNSPAVDEPSLVEPLEGV